MVKVNTGGVEKAMGKPRKKQGNPYFRHGVSVPAPASEEIELPLFELINPGILANLKGVKDKERSLRSRVLTLPVMAAIILSLPYLKVQQLTDVLRCLEIGSTEISYHLDWGYLNTGSHEKTFRTIARKKQVQCWQEKC
ncbi:hypothetical protein NWP20_13670 [Chrysosporum ovalisporum FSS-44]|nr:hypothetical protein [Umezakia ovalisporum]MDH6057268.1 hypothetical protein [Umezakia ovalisporum FSS-43]MDH6070265.1 hypothetical protein [Umezakia ovalisporum CobakiLakeA]MDH6082372.1 hypothetical protein [Umezakia ovalisporum FSS-44]MDH6095469.1 hypothetical protein [Umezakia ovalisporum CobakiLakeB]